MKLDISAGWQLIKDGAVRDVDLPHDAMLTEKRRANVPGGADSGYFPGGFYTYRKKLLLSKEQAGKQAALFFEGVYQNAKIYVNGTFLGEHRYGYTEFRVAVTSALHEGENEIEVTADNTLIPNCRWYSGAGIYRPVWLLLDEKPEPKVSTVSVSPAVIKVECEGEAEIYDGEKRIASGPPGLFEIENAKLWSAEQPYRYLLKADGHTVRFGIRSLSWSAETGLLVNGEKTLLRGGCIHHDNGVLGAADLPGADYRRVKILKEQGFNALRAAHNPAGRSLLEACDELGMYVMDECFDGWYIPKNYHDYSRSFAEGYQDDLRSMVEKDFNHPSVILYSIGNEVTETGEKRGIELAKEMRETIREMDPSRPVTCGLNVLLDVYTRLGMGIYRDSKEYRPEPLPEKKRYRERKTGSAFFNEMASKLNGLFFLMSKGKLAEKITADFAPSVDIVGLNYASSRYDPDAFRYPERIMVGSETMAKDLPYNWERVKKYPQLIGDFVWAAWDYLGEACIGDWTYHSYKGLPLLAGQGMIDMTGKPLASMAFMQTVWGIRDCPFLAVSPLNHAAEIPSKGAWQFTNAIDSWTWHGYEGKKTTAEVYADAARVRLELNGRTLAEKKIKDCRAVFKLNYEPGTLTAIALREDGSEKSRTALRTGGTKKRLTLRQERYGKLTYLIIEFTDENGELLPYVEQAVSVQTVGAVLLGFGSALCKTDERYDQTVFCSYRGRLLAVIKGKGKVIITSDGVEPAESEVEENPNENA